MPDARKMFAVVVDFVEFAYQILIVVNANAIIRKSQLKMKGIYRSYCKFITSPWHNPVHQQMLSFLVCALQRFPFPWPFFNIKLQERGHARAFWGFPSSLSPFFPHVHVRGGGASALLKTHFPFPPSSLYFGSRGALWPTFLSFPLSQEL